jgi:hypothetical protein
MENNIVILNWILNRNAILENRFEKVNWDQTSSNLNAIELLENNYDRIVWSHLSSNPNAIHILEQNTRISDNVKSFWRANEDFPTEIGIIEIKQ